MNICIGLPIVQVINNIHHLVVKRIIQVKKENMLLKSIKYQLSTNICEEVYFTLTQVCRSASGHNNMCQFSNWVFYLTRPLAIGWQATYSLHCSHFMAYLI